MVFNQLVNHHVFIPFHPGQSARFHGCFSTAGCPGAPVVLLLTVDADGPHGALKAAGRHVQGLHATGAALGRTPGWGTAAGASTGFRFRPILNDECLFTDHFTRSFRSQKKS